MRPLEDLINEQILSIKFNMYGNLENNSSKCISGSVCNSRNRNNHTELKEVKL